MTPTQSRSRCDNLGFEMDDTNEPGEFLRPRRNEVTAAAAGIPIGGDRSRPGLSREEVALRAGLSTDYFTRLERGPESDPSEQVVNAVSRPLQLDRRHAAEYFFRLTQPAPRATSTPVSAASDQFGAVFRTWIPHTGNGSRTPAGPVGRHLAGPGVVRPIRAVRQPVAHDLLRSRRPRVLRRLGPRRTWCGEQCAGPLGAVPLRPEGRGRRRRTHGAQPGLRDVLAAARGTASGQRGQGAAPPSTFPSHGVLGTVYGLQAVEAFHPEREYHGWVSVGVYRFAEPGQVDRALRLVRDRPRRGGRENFTDTTDVMRSVCNSL